MHLLLMMMGGVAIGALSQTICWWVFVDPDTTQVMAIVLAAWGALEWIALLERDNG